MAEHPDPLIDTLVADLRPVRPRRPWLEAAALAGLAALQFALFTAMFGVRPDFMPAMHNTAFWWKLISFGVLAMVAIGAVLRSLDPAGDGRGGIGRIAAIAAVALAAGWLIDAGSAGREALALRLNWHEGLHCVFMVVVLSIPAVIGLALLARRGAPTNRQATSLATGLAAAAWGGFVFAFSCPYDDPLYIAVWYAVAVAAVAIPVRWVLPHLTRW